jgi:hypothetical protein
MKLVIVLLALFLILPCAAAEPTELESRAIRVIWSGELERISDAVPSTNKCRTVDVSRVEAAAMALDTMTGLKLSDQVDWRNPLLDQAEVQRAADQWRKWLERNGSHIALSQVVTAVEKSMRWLAKQHEVP